MNFHQFLVPRLEGDEIESGFDRYLSLVKNGVAGFIIFGGEVEALRKGIERLQAEAALPLIIASDLEQGLGQQVRGGTTFPPAMAVACAEAKSPGLARSAFECVAREASYVGINTIFAPVLDVDTNPENPIISTRAFSDNPEEVAALGTMMSDVFIENSVVSCGKHFPGHGDTSIDSHLSLPKIDKTLEELDACELQPFRKAVSSGIPMLMLGHLSVPALDPSGRPVSTSGEAIRFLKANLGFGGMVITDAMNMGGLGALSAEDAALMALDAGVDLLLHPADADALAASLGKSGRNFSSDRVQTFRKTLSRHPSNASSPPLCKGLADELTRKALRSVGQLGTIKNPFVLVIGDEDADASHFVRTLRERFPSIGHRRIAGPTGEMEGLVPDGTDLIVAVYTRPKAFKGVVPSWVRETIKRLDARANALVSFGNPHVLDIPGSNTFRLLAWWDSPEAQLAAAKKILL